MVTSYVERGGWLQFLGERKSQPNQTLLFHIDGSFSINPIDGKKKQRQQDASI
jgi:hypothetical protein